MGKHIFIIYLLVSVFVCGCVTTQPAIKKATEAVNTCHDLIVEQNSVFFGQGYGHTYEIAMNNAQEDLSNNISSTIDSTVLSENSIIDGVVQTIFHSKSESTSESVPIDGYELVDSCMQENKFRVSLTLNKEGYKTILKQKLLKQIPAVNQLIAKVQAQDDYYKKEAIKELRIAYQELVQTEYLNGIYGDSLSILERAQLLYTEYSAKGLINTENNNFVAVKYLDNSFFAKGAIESALNNAGVKVTNIQNKSYVYLELKATENNRKVGSQYVSKLQLQLSIKKSKNNDILHTQNIGTGIGNSLTSSSFAKESAQRKLQNKLNYFLANKFSLLVKELKI